jgi:hypothetical protein
MAENLPCLGDVLSQAGYRQTYLGGAGLRFAGKGSFLRAHGFDKVVGQEEWAALGLTQRPGTWGVSDADLLERSLDEIRSLRASGQPFGLTLLTIGTHLPGYAYQECAPYSRSENRFLNALHCTDQLIGNWVERLKQDGLLDDTLLVITADHHIFPSPEMVELFGEAAVKDRRLPLVVMGDSSNRQAAVRVGAGYDLAPTLLDLLDVQHTARFALGRSLLRANAARDYFPSRYVDIYQGRKVQPHGDACQSGVTSKADLPLPLDRCGKSQLLTLMRAHNQQYSRPPSAANCNAKDALSASLPDDPQGDISIILGDQQQAARFTWKERALPRAERGLFLVALDRDGVLLGRSYAPPELAAEKPPSLPNLDQAAMLLAVWRTDSERTMMPPAWLSKLSGTTQDGAWLFSVPDGAVVASSQAHHEGIAAQRLQFDRVQCLSTFGSGLRAGIARHLGI